MGMYDEYCLWAQVAVLLILDYIALFGTSYAGIVFGQSSPYKGDSTLFL